MPALSVDADQQASSCHHCHLTSPIPLSQLVKTRPLRSGHDIDRSESRGRKNKVLLPVTSFLHRSTDTRRTSSSTEPDHTPSTSSSVVSHVSATNEVLVNLDDDSVAQEKLTSWNPLYKGKSTPDILTLRDIATQTTSGRNTASKTFFQKYVTRKSDSSVFLFKKNNEINKRRSSKYLCSLPSGLIFVGYCLLIVIGVVVSVALTQRSPRFQGQTRQATSFPGAFQAPQPSRPRIQPQQDFDFYDDSSALPARQTNAASVFPPFQSAPAPRPAAPAPRPVVNQAPARAPVQRAPQPAPAPRAPQAAAPRQTVDSSRRRQGPTKNFQSQFAMNDQAEPAPASRKEPDVQIIKSWATTHSDGSYTWGYINTDGSFKNETRGADCVVRGVYGYVEPESGDTLSYPYVSGNPCDPNAPDYYYDYDAGTINSDGAVVQTRSQPRTVANRPRRKQ